MKARTRWLTILSILVAVIISVGVYIFISIDVNRAINDNNIIVDNLPSILVTDVDTAYKAVENAAKLIGLIDFNNEVKFSQSSSADDTTFYRFSQVYGNIPVYGREIVLCASAKGKVEYLASNYLRIDGISSVPEISSEDAKQKLTNKLAEEFNCSKSIIYLSAGDLVIYIYNDKPELAFKFSVFITNNELESYTMYCSALDGQQINRISEVDSTSILGYFAGLNKIQTISVEYADPTYKMIDNLRNISGKYITSNGANDTIGLGDIINWNKSSESPNPADVDAMAHLEFVHDYFDDRYNSNVGKTVFVTGYNAQNAIHVYNGVENINYFVFGYFNKSLSGTEKSTASLIDVVAHEYSHAVSDNIVLDFVVEFDENNKIGETAAVVEAYSDIFGVIVESRYEDSYPDWIVAENTALERSLSEPSIAKYSDYFHGLECHTASTLTSNVAYKMYVGIDAPSKGYTKAETAIPNVELISKIWFNSLHYLLSTADFRDCRSAVESAARVMVEKGALSQAQYTGIQLAFDSSGIPAIGYFPPVTSSPNQTTISTTSIPQPTTLLTTGPTTIAFQPSDKPNLISPSNGSSFSGYSPTLSWSTVNSPSGGRIEYYVEIFDCPSPQNSGWITSTTWRPSATASGLYNWHVKSIDRGTGKESGYGVVWQYTIGSTQNTTRPTEFQPADKPNLLSPQNRSSFSGSFPTLSWSTVSSPSGGRIEYFVEIFDCPSPQNSGWITSTTWRPSATASGLYNWHVKSIDCGTGKESGYGVVWQLSIIGSNVINKFGNSAGNIANEGIAAIQGDWIYYASRDFTLCKIRTDGTDRTQLSNDSVRYINVVGEWIYFQFVSDNYYLYKIRTDGTGKVKLNSDGSYFISVVEDWIYYSNSGDSYNIYKIRTDGTGRTKVSSGGGWSLNIVGDYLYYCSNDFYICKIRTDGSEEIKIYKSGSSYINVIGDWIYYCASVNSLYKIRIDGTELTKLNDGISDYINVIGGWVYYRNFDDGASLYKIRTDGTERTKLNSDNIWDINIVGDWIYYYNSSDNDSLYKIHTDGTGRAKN